MNVLGAVKSVFCSDVNPISTYQKFGQACSDSSLLGSKHENPGFSVHGSYTCLCMMQDLWNVMMCLQVSGS
jgi:hypothetical protein